MFQPIPTTWEHFFWDTLYISFKVTQYGKFVMILHPSVVFCFNIDIDVTKLQHQNKQVLHKTQLTEIINGLDLQND